MEGGLGMQWIRFGSATSPSCSGDEDDLWFEFLLQMTQEGGEDGQKLEWCVAGEGRATYVSPSTPRQKAPTLLVIRSVVVAG